MTKKMKKAMVTMMMVVFAAMLLMVAPVQAASKTKTTKVTMKAGQSKTLRVKTAGKVKWSSSNKAIVSVNKKGKIVARRAGKAKITLGPNCAGNGKAHPWHLVHMDSKSNVYGWVDEGTFG